MSHKTANINNSVSSEELHSLKMSASEMDFSPSDEAKKKEGKRKDSKKIFSKKDSKDKGYASLNLDNSQESIFLMNNKSQKKSKPETKIGLFKKSKNSKQKKNIEHRLFSNSLENTINFYPSNDGVHIAYPIRVCFEIIDEKGLEIEGIYKRNIEKSHVDRVCESIENVSFESQLDELNASPLLAAGIVKKYFRELKSPLINEDFLNLFEKCEGLPVNDKIDSLEKLIEKLPLPNHDTFSYLIIHLNKVMQKSELNKMDPATLVVTFQPLIKIKERILKFMLKNSHSIFKDVIYKKYQSKQIDDTVSRSFLPDDIEELENEIAKQESILSDLHSKISMKNDSEKKIQEQLLEESWALQRYVTSLKRKVKKLKKSTIGNQTPEFSSTITSTITTAKDSQNDEAKKVITTNQKEHMHNKLENISEDDKCQSFCEQEFKILLENEILIENLKQLFEKLSKEKVKIFDLQQQYKTQFEMTNLNTQMDIINYDAINISEIQHTIDELNIENEIYEEKIRSINKKINEEKEKIFQLKLNKKIKNFKQSLNDTTETSNNNVNKEIQQNNTQDSGLMTKL